MSKAEKQAVAETEEKTEEELETTEETVVPAEEEETPSTEEEAETTETVPAAEEKESEEGEEEIEVVEEKIYTIPLRHVWVVTPRGKRAPRAVRDVRAYVSRHMKAEEVSISNEVNSAIWSRSINKPPRRITVRAVKDKEGKVIVYASKT
jgi:large subunit ribosomal protein L31e